MKIKISRCTNSWGLPFSIVVYGIGSERIYAFCFLCWELMFTYKVEE